MKKIFLTLALLAAAPLGAQTPTPTVLADSPQVLFDKAKQLFDQKHYDEARNSLGQLVAKYPTESFVPKARLLLANLEEDFTSATARFQMLSAEYEGSPEGAEAQKDLADRYYLADKYVEAAEGYKDYLDQYPKSQDVPEIRYWLGSSYMALDQADSAVEQFKKVLDTQGLSKDDPWASKSRVGLGNAYFKQGRYDQAEQQYLKILQDDPYYNELNLVYYKLGQTFELEKKDRQAYASYQTLLDRYPKALEVADAQARMKVLVKAHPDYASAADETPTPAGQMTAAVVTQTIVLTPGPTIVPTEPTQIPTSEPTAVPTESVESAPVQSPEGTRPFHAQVGVFTQKTYVTKAVKSLAKFGYKAFVVSAKSDSSFYTYYKVRVGQYAARSEAEKTAKTLSRLLKQQVIVIEDEGN